MATGMLLHMVLHKLAESPRSGYGLCTAIEESTGSRPSYGSIYPLLERLAHDGMVTVKEDGRKKVYSLTKSGREHAKMIACQKEELLDGLSVQIKALMAMAGQNPEPLLQLLERMRAGEPPIGAITAPMIRFRDLTFTMVQDGRVEKHKKEITKMLNEMTKRLEKMK